MTKLTLIRGLPGSGKSTLARKQAGLHLEADMFFIKNEEYCFDANLLVDAHEWCKNQTEIALQQGQAVVVSNTFIQWWQIEPYVQLAKQYGAKLQLWEARGTYQNVHDVPSEVLAEMKRTYQSNKIIMAYIKKMLPSSQLCLSNSPLSH
jgi:predicted kinase